MTRFLLLLTLFGLLTQPISAQLGGLEPPPEASTPKAPEDEDAEHELERLLKNQSGADTAFVNLRFGLFGPGAKKLHEEALAWAQKDRWNIALAYWYRCLDRNNKKYNEEAIKGLRTYGPKFLSMVNKRAIEAFNNNEGRTGYLYAFRMGREIKKAKEYNADFHLTPAEYAAITKAGEEWAQRALVSLDAYVKQRKHFTIQRNLYWIGVYVPAAKQTTKYKALEQEVETNGIRVVALPMFRGENICGELPGLAHAGFMDKLNATNRLIRVTSREINDELENEKIFAEIDDRPLTTDLKANLPGADYLVAGKVLTCDETPPRLRRSTVDAWQVRSYTVKDTAGNEYTRYCYDIPIKLEAINGNSSVSYTLGVSCYRVANGEVIYTKRLDKAFSSSVDYLYAPGGVTDVSTVKITEGSDEKPKRFQRPVEAKFKEPSSIPTMRRMAADYFDQEFAKQVFQAIYNDN